MKTKSSDSTKHRLTLWLEKELVVILALILLLGGVIGYALASAKQLDLASGRITTTLSAPAQNTDALPGASPGDEN